MRKPNPRQAKKHLEKLRQIIAQNPSPIFKMSKEEVIKTLRKTREKLCENVSAFLSIVTYIANICSYFSSDVSNVT